MTNILGPEWFPRTQADRDRLYADHISGSKHTNWSLLTSAARSNLVASARACADLLNLWGRLQAKKQQAAETELLLQINYARFVIGPLLGTILSSVIALESFLRLYAEVSMTPTGLNRSTTDAALAEFDSLPMHGRLARARELAKLPRMSKKLRVGLDALVSFRNDCVHDSPLTFQANRTVTRLSRGRAVQHKPESRYAGLFPALHDDPMPLGPSHALLAADLVDRYCWDVLDHGDPQAAQQIRALGSRALFRIVGFDVPREQVENVVEGWHSRLVPWLAAIDMSDREDFYRDVTRRFVVKAVDDESNQSA